MNKDSYEIRDIVVRSLSGIPEECKDIDIKFKISWFNKLHENLQIATDC